MNKEAFYSMGVIAWAKWYPAVSAARANLNMKPPDPGPLPDAAVRQQLKAQYSSLIEEGIANLDRALAIDPQYDDAMAYKNLLIRERADLRDTKEEWSADVAVADQWVQKALETKKLKAGSAGFAPPPPPPPGGRGPIRVGSVLAQQDHLIKKVDPVYPALARQARIQGVVRFTVRLAKDGTIESIQLISGHPLLVMAAQEALKQWVYSPTLLNGEAVEVTFPVDISFSLSQ
jgi:TonB family protein